eukprot:CAMPEP_0173437264 /NCGR_PEP_ID=MMETSP1357-20121228/17933_1 /TAXON_ID=77926 /ORGANISM="Hemiselmis rufescens, Strain PCC563" /LENGTH=154 /DNA_ID=CAMNT_0014402433 /DNA_START=121 /DNA_END=586 /DNA_ORIENTATION=+
MPPPFRSTAIRAADNPEPSSPLNSHTHTHTTPYQRLPTDGHTLPHHRRRRARAQPLGGADQQHRRLAGARAEDDDELQHLGDGNALGVVQRHVQPALAPGSSNPLSNVAQLVTITDTCRSTSHPRLSLVCGDAARRSDETDLRMSEGVATSGGR